MASPGTNTLGFGTKQTVSQKRSQITNVIKPLEKINLARKHSKSLGKLENEVVLSETSAGFAEKQNLRAVGRVVLSEFSCNLVGQRAT